MTLTTDPVKQNRFVAEAMYIMASVLHYGKSGLAKKSINEDDTDSINVCLRVISERSSLIVGLFDNESKQALSTLLEAKLSDDIDGDSVKKSAKKLHNIQVILLGIVHIQYWNLIKFHVSLSNLYGQSFCRYD